MSTLALALGLMLLIEGILPLVAPHIWRETFRRATEFSDGQLRFVGLASIGVGLVLVMLFS